jgi:hypothetical protein
MAQTKTTKENLNPHSHHIFVSQGAEGNEPELTKIFEFTVSADHESGAHHKKKSTAITITSASSSITDRSTIITSTIVIHHHRHQKRSTSMDDCLLRDDRISPHNDRRIDSFSENINVKSLLLCIHRTCCNSSINTKRRRGEREDETWNCHPIGFQLSDRCESTTCDFPIPGVAPTLRGVARRSAFVATVPFLPYG